MKTANASLLQRSFFEHHPRIVARELLGKLLIRRDARGKFRIGRIVETEAYGANDPASHTYNGKTARNAVIFGPPGHAYVYFTYGMHYCMNVTCQPENTEGCILLRALEPMDGITAMAKARGLKFSMDPTPKDLRSLTSGPARLCAALDITRERDNGCNLLKSKSSLFLADDGFEVRRIRTSTRIGISKAIEKKWRYFIDGNAFVSK